MAVDELPIAAADDEFGLAEDLEMVRDGRRGHAAHGDDLATGHVAGRRHGLKDSKPRLVRQGFRYFLNLGTRHARSLKCSEVVGPVATESDGARGFQKTCIRLLRCSSKCLNLTGKREGQMTSSNIRQTFDENQETT